MLNYNSFLSAWTDWYFLKWTLLSINENVKKHYVSRFDTNPRTRINISAPNFLTNQTKISFALNFPNKIISIELEENDILVEFNVKKMLTSINDDGLSVF